MIKRQYCSDFNTEYHQVYDFELALEEKSTVAVQSSLNAVAQALDEGIVIQNCIWCPPLPVIPTGR